MAHHGRCQLGVAKVAEFPQFLRRPRVLKEDLVDAEGIQVAATETVDRGTDALHQRSQLALVVSRHGLSRSVSVIPRGHRPRLVRPPRPDVRHSRTSRLKTDPSRWVI